LQKLRDHLWRQVEAMRLEFPEQRSAWGADSQLVAILCGRRSGKTKGGCEQMVIEAATSPGGRFLYLNSTHEECEKLAWYGLKNDGMAALCSRLTGLDGQPLRVKINSAKLQLHFLDVDSWIYLKGADQDAKIRKALGLAYNKVWWDEAQKIPTALTGTIREVLMPALLDVGGSFFLSGTPVRNMAGLFYDATRHDLKRRREWSMFKWNLLQNPFFGATEEERLQRGMIGLQNLLGGPDIAPLDGPIMRREGYGEWTHEDAAYVYWIHKVAQKSSLYYAPDRRQPNGFPDLERAMQDLPGFGKVHYFTALGADIGYSPDPFSFCVWAWNLQDENIYEIGTWKETRLDSEQQAAVLRRVRDIVNPCVAVADAGGSARPSVAGWEKEWMDRYGLPITPAKKNNKNGAIERYNADIVRGRMRFREGSPLVEELEAVQWATVRSSTGLLVEDPTIPNDIADASLYGHRGAYHHRYEVPEERPDPGTAEWAAREEARMRLQAEQAAEYD
jgi:hypothetical protein